MRTKKEGPRSGAPQHFGRSSQLRTITEIADIVEQLDTEQLWDSLKTLRVARQIVVGALERSVSAGTR